MSLDKAILHGKEHRKPYRGAKAADSACRNHGGCPWCTRNRLYSRIKVEMESVVNAEGAAVDRKSVRSGYVRSDALN